MWNYSSHLSDPLWKERAWHSRRQYSVLISLAKGTVVGVKQWLFEHCFSTEIKQQRSIRNCYFRCKVSTFFRVSRSRCSNRRCNVWRAVCANLGFIVNAHSHQPKAPSQQENARFLALNAPLVWRCILSTEANSVRPTLGPHYLHNHQSVCLAALIGEETKSRLTHIYWDKVTLLVNKVKMLRLTWFFRTTKIMP